MKIIISKSIPVIGLFIVAALIQACSSGSGGSDVGNSVNEPPTARAQVLNVGADNTFREGSEVLLSGKDSEDADGPILDWEWSQTAGPGVLLIERTTNVVSFTAPDVSVGTSLTFQLEVTDSNNETGTESVTINVIPAQDADGFLTLSLRGGDARRNAFSIIPGLAAGTGQDEPFTLSVQAYLIYPVTGSSADCTIVGLPADATVPPTVGSCAVGLLQDLTSGGFADIWSGAAPASQPSDADGIIDSIFNPRHTFRVPRIDVDDFNQQFLPDQRDQTLDASSIDQVVVALRVELAATDPTAAGSIVGATAPSSRGGRGIFLNEPNDNSGSPITRWLSLGEVTREIQDAETSLTGAVYARTIDPAGKRTTLNDWLCQAGFAEPADCGPLPAGETRIVTLRDEALVGASTPTEEEFAHAIYLNNYDLGFGRDMFSRVEVNDENTGNVYSWVNNYPTLEGAIRHQQPVVTVVMEYSPPEDANGLPVQGAPSFTKFFTYAPDGSGDSVLVNSMNFDGRGELATPGNCVACHGGVDPGANPDPAEDALILNTGEMDSVGNMCTSASTDPVCYTFWNGGDLSATFLPWDVDSLLFADTDPAILNAPVPFDGVTLLQELEALPGSIGIRKSEQLNQITRLNESALATFAQDSVRNAPGIALLEHWYGNPVDMDIDTNPPMIVGSYEDSGAPLDWQAGETPAGGTMANDAGSDQLYQDVYARNCRMCHTSIFDETLQFNDYESFITEIGCGSKPPIDLGCGRGIYTRGIMPAARLTMDRFWTDFDGSGVAGDLLEEHLRAVGRIDLNTDLTPSEAVANITLLPDLNDVNGATTIVLRNSVVRLSGQNSDFASGYSWTEGNGYPSPGPSFVGANTEQVAFIPDAAGVYPVVLTINGSTSATTTVEVENYVPEANVDLASAQPSGSAVTIDFLGNDRFQLEVCSGACPQALTIENSLDLPISISNILLITDADPDGSIVLETNAACTLDDPAGCADDRLVYTPANATDTYSDTFEYTITDVDQDSSTGFITIEAQQALAASAGAPPTVTSEILATLRISATGGAQATGGGDRYTVSQVAGSGPSIGVVSGLGTFNTFLDFSYVSNQFRTGAESFTLRVSDSATPANPPVDVIFNFTVQPQDTFSLRVGSTRPSVSQIVSDQTNCASMGCHDGTSTGSNFLSASLFTVVSGLVDTTNGNVNGINVDNSLILCHPTLTCPNTHVGGNALIDSTNNPELSVVTRWLQEGAQNN